MYLKSQNSFLAALYMRLSKDDGDKVESDSIRNQRSLLRDFVKQHSDITLVKEYVDDGFSGTNFERPDFQRMLEDARNHKINCIIVKDLSRLGRNYIETGRYLEKIFPVLGIRFIAVNDHYDSADTTNDSDQIIVPFKNLVNDAYCRDISIVALIVKADEIIAQIENLPQQQFGLKILDTQMKTLHKEIQKYEELKANLYQDMVDKIISREEYRELKQNFSKKIENAKVSMKGLEEKKKRMLSNEMRTQQWVTEFKQYRNIKSLDRKTVVMLIDRIVVYSTDRIEIHFNYEDEITEFVKYAFANGDLLRKVGEL